MHFNNARDHCTDSVALACIVNVFTACKSLILFWDKDYGLQRFSFFFLLSPNMKVVFLTFTGSNVQLHLC